MEEEINLLNNAYEIYNLDNREDLSERILNYIAERMIVNKIDITRLIEALNIQISFSDIWNTFEEARAEEELFKQTIEFKKHSQGFFEGIYLTSKGNIVIETDNVLDIIRYFVKAIKSRNTITISKLDYNEVSIESVILVIFCEALNKFGLDRNLLMIMPYEECEYEKYDEIVLCGKTTENPIEPDISSKYIIYLNDDRFSSNVEIEKKRLEEKNIEYEVITDEFYSAIKKINYINPISAAIYTSDNELGYKFINLVHSKNVFVNTTLLNTDATETQNDDNIYYLKKKIIYPMINYDNQTLEEQSNIEDDKENNSNVIQFNNEINTIHKDATTENKELQNENNIADESTTEQSLTISKANTWYRRIFEAIKRFFKK